MNIASTVHFPHIFISGVRASSDKPFIFEKHAKMYISSLRKEVASQVNSFARALHSVGVDQDMRVAFCALPPSQSFWISECAVLSIRATAAIIPADFALADRIGALAETRSKVVVVATLADATALAQSATGLPDLTHIICCEGKAPAALPILDWREFVDSGRMHPDRTADLLASIASADTAMLFYAQGEGKAYQVTRYTHAQLLEHAYVIERLLGIAHPVHNTDIMLTSSSWDHPVAHIVSCFLPLLRDAAIQINADKADFACLDNHPQVLIATAAYLDTLRAHIEQQVRQSGTLEWNMLQKAIAYGKLKYESAHKMGRVQRLFDNALQVTVVKKVVHILGGRLRLIIGVDDATSYDTQLFFHAFGVDLVEVPAEAFRAE
jgi:long-subunit acyl-CoA synthetase (AMP-forming)